jgi:hypothetical protein
MEFHDFWPMASEWNANGMQDSFLRRGFPVQGRGFAFVEPVRLPPFAPAFFRMRASQSFSTIWDLSYSAIAPMN